MLYMLALVDSNRLMADLDLVILWYIS